MVAQNKLVLGSEVLAWPEFKALMDRFGFERPERMLAFKLNIAMDSVASVTVTYLLGEDESCEPS